MNDSNVMHVDAVHLSNGDILEDKDVYLHPYGYVFVSSDQEDGLPTLYNKDEVMALQGVLVAERKPGKPKVVLF